MSRGVGLFQESRLRREPVVRSATGSVFHILIVAVSAGIALWLPAGARQFLSFWSRVERETSRLIAVEMAAAIALIVLFSLLHRGLRDRSLAAVAAGAGLVSFYPRQTADAQQRIKALKDEQGTGRSIMVMGSSGYGGFADQMGDLTSLLDRCVEAKILLMNPFGSDTSARIQAQGRSMLPAFRAEVRRSITLLKRLKALGKSVTLKLYDDPPLLKLVILGDHVWLQHAHGDLDVEAMPEYVLRRNGKEHGLYSLYAHYFAQRWACPDIPEYDLETDELVHRNRAGQEVRRERLEPAAMEDLGRAVRPPSVAIDGMEAACGEPACFRIESVPRPADDVFRLRKDRSSVSGL